MGAWEGMKVQPAYAKWRRRLRALLVLAIAANGVRATCAQETSGTPAASSKPSTDTQASSEAKSGGDSKSELSSKDTNTTFKLRVNLVQVKVVVRDEKGNPIRDLKREDFQLFDQGKPQVISTFDLETPETRKARTEAAAKTQQGADGESPQQTMDLPERFVALVFDDIHLTLEDATFVRSSAKKLIETMAPTDRLGIFGTSEQVKVDFTNDKSALEQVLNSIVPRPKMGKINSVTNCPDVTHYMADQSINKNDTTILPVVTTETLQCMFNNDPHMLSAAQQQAAAALQQELVSGDTDNEFTYRALEDIIRRMTTMPGERVIALASPGFILSTQFLDEMGIIDRATKAGVVINTVDARGLYAPDIMGDISQHSTDTIVTAGQKASYRTAEQSENAFVLMDFANGTGGTFYQNSNDVAGELVRAGGTPEVSYILGFSPQNQKMDGKFHAIKVTLTVKRKCLIQARRGYYAPKKVDDPQEQAKAELQEAVFSQDEIQELPLELQTQYFKSNDADAHLSVVSHIDLKGIPFRKADGRNFDNLTVATVIFDENGNFVTGGEKILEMRLLDTTYTKLSHTGLVMKSSFDVKPGKYLVRQVIRDSEGSQMAAKNGAVVIPN